MTRTPRRSPPRAAAPAAPSPSTAAPAPSPGASAETAPETAAAGSDGSASAASPELPAPADAALQPLATEQVADPETVGDLEQLETIDPATGHPVPPLAGLANLGALALDRADANGARMEPTLEVQPPIPDAALAQAHLRPGDPATGSPSVDQPPADPTEPATLDLSEADEDFDEAAWKRRQLRRVTRPGVPVTFREHDRRFNGLATTPAIITRVYDDMVVNLMVLPDGGEPYPRLAVPFEAELDPEARGRAWSHINFDDD